MLHEKFKQGAFRVAAISVLTAAAPVIGSMTKDDENTERFVAMTKEFLTELGAYLQNEAVSSEFLSLMKAVDEALDAKQKAA